MKNSELQKALKEFPDDMEVLIFDHKKNLMTDFGDGSSEGIYEFDISKLNDDLSEDELDFHKDRNDGEELKVFIVLSFDNPDIEIPE